MVPSMYHSIALRSTKALQRCTNRSSISIRRSFSAEARPGAGVFQRITSFFVGAGLMALGTQYYLYQELKEGNKLMLQKQKDLEKRIQALEK